MYAIEEPIDELLMLNEHGVITLLKIDDDKFNNLYEIKRVNEDALIDYEVICISCEKDLKIYDPEARTLREPTNWELKAFVLRS